MSLEFEAIARKHFGEPNKAQSSKHELRFGRNGSKSVDLEKGIWFDHENGKGGSLFTLPGEGNGHSSLNPHAAAKDIAAAYDDGADPFKNVSFKKKGPPNGASFRVVKTWIYTDEAGEELFQVCRLENGEIGTDGKPTKTYRQRHKDPAAPGQYINHVKGIRQVPYRLPELISAVEQWKKIVFVVEGEKCADAIAGVGGAATCNAMGAGKWPDELIPFFKGAEVVILPDNDEPGEKHAALVLEKLQGVAKRARILELPGLPPKGDVANWIAAGGTLEHLHALAEGDGDTKSVSAVDGPLPLFPPLPDAEPYPVDALGPTLSRAAKAIASKVQVPVAMAAQSVLAAASLATCAHADVMLPFGQSRPLALFCVTIAASGDRKSTADNEALWPINRREAVLREENIEAMREWRIEHTAWSAEKRKIESAKIELSERKVLLAKLGDEPERPLEPNLISDNPTVEGLTKNWPNSHAALGIFSAEGTMFTAGFGMAEENRLKTAATLSAVWDGRPIKRIRAGDGVSVLPGRRLALHLMIQPDAAGAFLSSVALRDQGLLSRILVAHPDSMAGARLYKETSPGDAATIKAYGARLLSILELPPAPAPDKRNELAPPALVISAEATAGWIKFHDHIESQSGSDLARIKDFAAKAAEHAARIAGVITIVEDLFAKEISAATMTDALILADWYVAEACRLERGGFVDPALKRAAILLDWLQSQPDENVAFREILRLGPNATRTKATADEALAILIAHGWISEVSARPRIIKVTAL